jgi:hypothetical protein
MKVTLPCQLLERHERREFGPALQIYCSGTAPVLVMGDEGVLRTNYLAFKIGCKIWAVFGQACKDVRRLSQGGLPTYLECKNIRTEMILSYRLA